VHAALARWGAAALGALALVWSLRPYAPEPSVAAVVRKVAAVDLRPLAALFERSDVYGVADVAIGFLLYAPIGAWLAARAAAGTRAGGPTHGAWPGVLLALGSELTQAAVAGRTVDLTDALVQGAGVLVGWAVLRRAAERKAGAPVR
jgi:VanZ family protein